MRRNSWIAVIVFIMSSVTCAALYSFNLHHFVDNEYLVINIAALLWLPMLFIFFVIRQEPTSFGFGLGDPKRGYKLAAVLFVLLLPILIYASRRPDFQSYYPIDRSATNSLADFLRFELIYGMYLFCWEFFFRGFMLFGIARWIGVWSVFIQAIAFGIMHLTKVPAEAAASFAAGIILGVMALKSKSFMPCFVLHWAVAVTFDVLIVMGSHKLLF